MSKDHHSRPARPEAVGGRPVGRHGHHGHQAARDSVSRRGPRESASDSESSSEDRAARRAPVPIKLERAPGLSGDDQDSSEPARLAARYAAFVKADAKARPVSPGSHRSNSSRENTQRNRSRGATRERETPHGSRDLQDVAPPKTEDATSHLPSPAPADCAPTEVDTSNRPSPAPDTQSPPRYATPTPKWACRPREVRQKTWHSCGMIIAKYVLASDVPDDSIRKLLEQTPAHLIVIVVGSPEPAVAARINETVLAWSFTEQTEKRKLLFAALALNQTCLLWRRDKIWDVKVKASTFTDSQEHFFDVARCVPYDKNPALRRSKAAFTAVAEGLDVGIELGVLWCMER